MYISEYISSRDCFWGAWRRAWRGERTKEGLMRRGNVRALKRRRDYGESKRPTEVFEVKLAPNSLTNGLEGRAIWVRKKLPKWVPPIGVWSFFLFGVGCFYPVVVFQMSPLAPNKTNRSSSCSDTKTEDGRSSSTTSRQSGHPKCGDSGDTISKATVSSPDRPIDSVCSF